jgi:hypothetical protein
MHRLASWREQGRPSAANSRSCLLRALLKNVPISRSCNSSVASVSVAMVSTCSTCDGLKARSTPRGARTKNAGPTANRTEHALQDATNDAATFMLLYQRCHANISMRYFDATMLGG